MAKFYSASARGFFDPEIHGKNIPGDAVEISEEEWAELLKAQSAGRIIRPTEDGKPFAFEADPIDISIGRRRARDTLLAETDWLVARHRDELEAQSPTTLSANTYQELQAWRAQLREITKHKDWPKVQFPARPTGI